MPQILALFLCVWSICTAKAQVMSWDDFLNNFVDNETGSGEEGIETDVDRLQEMHENPFNLNDCSRDDLLQLPFIGPQQADSILIYIHKNGAILSEGELMLVHALDYYSRTALPLFVYFGEAGDDRKLRSFFYQLAHGRQEVAGVAAIPLYKRQGFSVEPSSAQHYSGGRLGGSLRYRNMYGNSLSVGVTGKNDDGEPFAKDGNVPFDSYSFYVFQKRKGVWQSWVLGDYKIHIGKGLTSGIGFMNSGMGLLMSRHDHGQGIFVHSGTSEYGFLRGGATTFSIGNLCVMGFGSIRKIDGRVEGDSLLSILSTGYHRLRKERERKNNVEQAAAGLSADYQKRNFHVGLSAVYVHYDHSFIQGARAYQQYNMEGKGFGNIGLHYSYERRRFNAGGEMAVAQGGQIALLHNARCDVFRDVRLFLQHRYYGKSYQAPLAWAYSGGGKCRGEHGAMLGLMWQPRNKWMLSGFADGYRLLTASYRALQPANGYTLQGDGEYKFSSNARIGLRYNLRSRQESHTKHPELLYAMKHSLRVQTEINVGCFDFVTSLDGCYFKPAVGHIQRGGMFSERVSTTWAGMRLILSVVGFHTDGYESSVYFYQPALRYVRNTSAFFYHGYAGTCVLQRQLGKHLDLSGMFSLLHYTNHDTIGTADRAIHSPQKCDLTFQLRWLI